MNGRSPFVRPHPTILPRQAARLQRRSRTPATNADGPVDRCRFNHVPTRRPALPAPDDLYTCRVNFAGTDHARASRLKQPPSSCSRTGWTGRRCHRGPRLAGKPLDLPETQHARLLSARCPRQPVAGLHTVPPRRRGVPHVSCEPRGPGVRRGRPRTDQHRRNVRLERRVLEKDHLERSSVKCTEPRTSVRAVRPRTNAHSGLSTRYT